MNLQLVVLLKTKADIAQLVEHLICNQDVVGSIPIEGFFFEDYHLIKNDSGLMVARESR